MKKITFFFLAVTPIFISCKKHNAVDSIFKGPEVQVYNGKAYTWLKIHDFHPNQLGVTLTNDVLNNLPQGKEDNTKTFVLNFHPKVADQTPFDHVYLEWNPNGHPPVFFVPHFDFAFYMTSIDAQLSIPSYFIDSSGFKQYPANEYLPSKFLHAPVGQAMKGLSWSDVTLPEWHGGPFTQTFIYGTYGGKITFNEEKITLNFLKNNLPFERSLPVPAKVMKSSFYPTKLKVARHDGVTDIILYQFVYRQQS